MVTVLAKIFRQGDDILGLRRIFNVLAIAVNPCARSAFSGQQCRAGGAADRGGISITLAFSLARRSLFGVIAWGLPPKQPTQSFMSSDGDKQDIVALAAIGLGFGKACRCRLARGGLRSRLGGVRGGAECGQWRNEKGREAEAGFLHVYT